MTSFMSEKGLNPLKQLMVPMAMAPIFVSCFFGLRKMANLPVESMKTGGMLWFTDLTVCDPYYILPLITSTTLWLTLETGADSARLSSSPNSHLMKYVFRALPLIVFPFTMNFPAALLCYWCSTNAVSLLQVTFLRIPKVRDYLNIEQLKNHKADSLPKKNKGFIKDAKEAWTNMKITKQLEERERFDEQMYKRAGRAPIPKTYKYDPTKVQPIQAKQK
ncbi:unnamed protein product [Allacma fusca]|uniref:Membrane insertase YidC/Oxa/ALB C-terminal domain-containing protein n=2 Tax=Allacma fusca TaxID=39272 RepID=A0A8J2L013_9HEXA|nr:unnamed protein product [Allacma fusca]